MSETKNIDPVYPSPEAEQTIHNDLLVSIRAIVREELEAKIRGDWPAAHGDGCGVCRRVIHVLLPDTVDEGAFQRFAELVRKEFSAEFISS